MRYYFLLFIATVFNQVALSQISLGAIASPNISWVIQSGTNKAVCDTCKNSQTWQRNIDSLNKEKSAGVGFDFRVFTLIKINKDLKLQTGLGLRRNVFSRHIDGLKFLDQVHPQLGSIFDVSQTTKSVDFHYRFATIYVPIVFVKALSTKLVSNDFKFFSSFGTSIDFNIKSSFVADFNGFTLKGKTSAKIAPSDYPISFINLTPAAGIGFEYNYQDLVFFQLHPQLAFNVLSVTKPEVITRFVFLQLQTGCYYRF